MDRATPEKNKRTRGFSLVLSLVIMSAMVLTAIVLAAFLSVESRSAALRQSLSRSRLNCIMSARLALAHLQQEAGPDRRATARGELACDPTPVSPWPLAMSAKIRIGQGQNYWTGVWRSDKPDQPPAWIISGRGDRNPTLATTAYLGQSASLANASDYTADYWTPWQTSYPVAGNATGFVVLVGNATAARGPGPDNVLNTADDIDGRIALPRIPFPGASLGEVTGNFAYWVGDEGLKTRVNLSDPRLVGLTTNAPASPAATDILRAPGRAGTELLVGFKSVLPNEPALGGITSDLLYAVPAYNPNDPAALGVAPVIAKYHDHSYFSAGVLADAYHGGLKRDLSLAFEMEDQFFDLSEFGAGPGNATEVYATDPRSLPVRRRAFFPYDNNTTKSTILSSGEDARLRVWVPSWESNPDNPGRGNPGLSQTVKGFRGFPWSPVFLRDDEVATGYGDGAPRRVVGPLWHQLRDYYRLYKEVDWVGNAPTLDARSFYPGTNAFLEGGFTTITDGQYELNHGYWPNGATDPMGNFNPTRNVSGSNQLLPRAIRGAYMPIIHRLSLVYSVKRVAVGANYSLRLICTPILVLHNPYNVALSLRSASAPENDPLAQGAFGRISWTRQTGIFFNIMGHTGNDPANPLFNRTSASILDMFSMTRQSDSEDFVSLVPAGVLSPGEFRVYSASDLVPATRVNLLKPGLTQQGGFYADVRTREWNSAANSPDATTPLTTRVFGANEVVSTWFHYTGSSWYHYFYFRSAGKQHLANDLLSTLGNDLGAHEIVSVAQRTSTASLGTMIDVGSFGGNINFHGHPGSQATPVLVPPLSQLRDFSETGKPGPVVAVFDTRIRVADSARTTSYNRDTFPWAQAQANPIPAPNPVYLFSNPLAQSTTVPGNNGMPSVGSPSYRVQVFGGDELMMNGSTNWSNFLEIDASRPNGTNTYGGNSHSSAGVTAYVPIELPTMAPLSLGQLMHVNFTTWDWFNYRTVGNSFPNLNCPLDKAWVHSVPYNPNGLTFPDYSYLMNSALWDGFFFSGAAPRLAEVRAGDYNTVRTKKTADVLADFANRVKPLANPRMRLFPPAALDPASVALLEPGFHTPISGKAPSGYKRLPGYLLNEGAFNVNSTSVEAWTALFSSLKQVGLGQQNATAPSSTNNARFPRVIGPASQTAASRNLRDEAFWSGFANLSDAQLAALAKGTVDEIKARTRFLQRTERDQDYPPTARRFLGFPSNKNPGTPFLGLCEFVNRFLGPTGREGNHFNSSLYSPTGLDNQANPFPALPGTAEANKWMFRSGTLESAIARADKSGSGLATGFTSALLIDPSVSHKWGTAGQRSGMPPGCYFRNIEILNPESNDNRVHTGFGANGCLFQGDLLQALGPILANRSDTFIIRAYGDSMNGTASGDTSTVLEIIVQRTPEFMSTVNAPETRLEDPLLVTVNKLLGRRFVVLSARWLTPTSL